MRDEGGCLYRGLNGTKCAVGMLLADDEVTEYMEGQSVERLADSSLLPERLLPHVTLLKKLQYIHDSAHSVADESTIPSWKTELTSLAESRNLTVNF